MRKRILSLLLILGLVTTTSITAFAEPLSDSLVNQNEVYKQAQNKVEDIEISIEKLDSDIEKIMIQVDQAKVKMGKTQLEIEKSKKDIQDAEDNILEEEDLFNKRMRSMYINGVDSYIEVLLDSEGIEDLISRVENIKKIVEYDNDIIGGLTDKKDEIEDQKEILENEKTKLALLTTDNEVKISSLKDKKQKQIVLNEEAKKQRRLYAGMVSEGQAIVNISMNQINAVKADSPKYTLSRGATSLSSNSIVAYASNFLGTPYAWGGNGPSNFDCSGFVKYVYAHFGVSIGRSTSDQINDGSYVSRENLQPGDLIFFGSSSDPHHVGMYVGNNSYIHSPSTGDVVKISALTRNDYIGARRVK
ncbi:C40 family peptidase [Clostridium bowmanii]|uniref:C40 family peptidase n=1 Tax=Clostridium bowmanii TaxID=132925 RepID=UPI001C0D5593|nr:C40 family peptidase [Clostridium bowmanii]MBU3188499.1 C40 family peptidase [Clostridium bowmanii]MCA1072883.1 C40 family peptidase [Clostridium bowmanii]